MGNGNDIYRTTFTPLAAWLITEGFELLEADFSDPRSVVFLFKNDTQALEQAVMDYKTTRAVGNINLFYENYRKLLAKISLGV